MAMQEALGRLYNVVSPADDVYVNLSKAAGVSFSIFEVDGATSTTITFAADAAGTGAVTPDIFDHWYGRSNDTVSGVWHKSTQAAADTIVAADGTEDHIIIEVLASMCPDGKPYVKATVDGSGTCTAILHDLAFQRDPANLASVTA